MKGMSRDRRLAIVLGRDGCYNQVGGRHSQCGLPFRLSGETQGHEQPARLCPVSQLSCQHRKQTTTISNNTRQRGRRSLVDITPTDVAHQGQVIAQYRKAKKWSQQDLAEVLCVDERTVQRMEKQQMIKSINL